MVKIVREVQMGQQNIPTKAVEHDNMASSAYLVSIGKLLIERRRSDKTIAPGVSPG
jgi:hypothetical protein